MKKIIYILFFLFVTNLNTISANTHFGDSVKFSLLTCSPGTEIYSLFGHTAIRYENPAQNMDIAFNYGIFSFNTPDFIRRFVKGETDYQLGVTEFRYFESEYYLRGSSVFQQTLNLLPEEKEQLWKILELNYRKENRIYRYNYFYDNCTTRARDKIEESLSGDLIYKEDPNKLSFRDIIHQYTKGHEWSQFGIDFCVGSQADKIIDDRQKMFAPFYLLEAFKTAEIVNGNTKRKIVSETTEIVPAEIEQQTINIWLTPLKSGWIAFFIISVFSIWGIWKQKTFWGIDIILFLSVGLAGCIITFLALFSVHPAVSPNYLLFVFHPIHILYLPFMTYNSIKGRKDIYHWLNLIVLTLFTMLWGMIPQKFNPAILPLALSLSIRSLSLLLIQYKKTK